ncbi:hypothetical protein [Catalinimonas niigatensis]|uniref:hypothetical protein n=1 Tax=Catalinimonas niigatensis TaxID=1397264 RepID=UPI002665B150|nr:hypothetical protein [Catalinimonas niigatensis]WPP48652.1 hypothetical protein PZB72_18440 [Catalinimonas niigatensis]
MKRITLYFSAILIVLSSLSMGCRSATVIPTGSSDKQIPPGQMKKMTGSKSAKTFAPGQQKKKKKH